MKLDRLPLTVENARELLGISRALAHKMARTGRLPTVRFGNRIAVPKEAIETILERCVSSPSRTRP